MVISIALIKVVPGKEKPVYHLLKNTDIVKRLYHIFGDHDFLLLLEAQSKGDLSRKVEQIMGIDGIAAVDTVLIGKESYLEERKYIERDCGLYGRIDLSAL